VTLAETLLLVIVCQLVVVEFSIGFGVGLLQIIIKESKKINR